MSITKARKILGFDENIDLTIEDITKRYRELSKKFHPDLHSDCNDDEIKFYNDKMVEINAAYDFIKSNISHVNDYYNHSSNYSYDEYQTFFFYIKRTKYDTELRSIFENANSSSLKNEVINLYNKINIMSAKNEDELQRKYDEFYSLLNIIYRNNETRFRILNKIPNSFKIKYTCNKYDIDSFLEYLDRLFISRKKYIKRTLDQIYKKYFDINNSTIILFTSSDSFNTFMSSYYDKFNNNLSYDEEVNLINRLDDEMFKISTYFDKHKAQYIKIKKEINKLSNDFNVNNMSKTEMLENIDNSIITSTFTSCEYRIQKCLKDYNSKIKYINNLKRILSIKSKISLLRLNPSKDKNSIKFILETLEIVYGILDCAVEKYSVDDLSILENISFNDFDNDKLLISLFNKEEFDIYITYRVDEFTVRSNPFVLSNGKTCLEVENDDKIVCKTNEEISLDTYLISLDSFIRNGNIINYTQYYKNGYETILCQYNGSELIYKYDYNHNKGSYYLRPISIKYSNSSNRNDMLKHITYDVCTLFDTYSKKNNKSDKFVRTLNIKSL